MRGRPTPPGAYDGGRVSSAAPPPGTAAYEPPRRRTAAAQAAGGPDQRRSRFEDAAPQGRRRRNDDDDDDYLGESASQSFAEPPRERSDGGAARPSADAVREELARHFELLQRQISGGMPAAAAPVEDRVALHRELTDLESELAALTALEQQHARLF